MPQYVLYQSKESHLLPRIIVKLYQLNIESIVVFAVARKPHEDTPA